MQRNSVIAPFLSNNLWLKTDVFCLSGDDEYWVKLQKQTSHFNEDEYMSSMRYLFLTFV